MLPISPRVAGVNLDEGVKQVLSQPIRDADILVRGLDGRGHRKFPHFNTKLWSYERNARDGTTELTSVDPGGLSHVWNTSELAFNC